MKKYKFKKKPEAGLRHKVSQIFIQKPFDTFNAKQIGRKINFKGSQKFDAVHNEMSRMAKDGILEALPHGVFKLKHQASSFHTGRVDFVNPRFCFVIVPELENDVKVDLNNMKGALDGDTVTVGLMPNQRGKNPEGEIHEIVKRNKREFVGVLEVGSSNWVIPDNRKMHDDIFVRHNDVGEAKSGEKVLVKITRWGTADNKPEGKITSVLGKEGDHETEMHSIMYEFDLPMHFPKSVEKEANEIPLEIPAAEIQKRRDFRNVTTFTIDPLDAKDFDDAISVRTLPNGNLEIGVHIADVSHYVQQYTQLDNEAFSRATSVYLVDRVIPMLPERLSNGLCSLRPNEEKCTFSAVFEMNHEAEIMNEWYGRTVIFSDRRFTYEEAQERIESKEGDFAQEIGLLNHLAYKLRDKRYQEGSISFETPEVRFRLDDQGVPLEVVTKVRKDAHKLVEDFMLLANKGVATFVFNKMKDGGPTMVYRTHDDPDQDRLASFSTFASKFGHRVSFEGNISKAMNKLTQAIEGRPESNMLQQLAIRSMAKAIYTTEPKGHFGLGFEHYTHFTSPIRRYPDLMVHRLLQHYLDGGESVVKEEMEDNCKHSSEREKVAASAERASIKYKQVEYIMLQDKDVFEGIISGITEWGMYIEMTDAKCEGLLRYSELTDDKYIYDEDNLRAVGFHNKKMYSFGDPMTVRVLRTDLRNRTIDLGLPEAHDYNDLNFDK